MTDLASFTLERLWEDGELVLFRGTRGTGLAPVLVVAPALQLPVPETIARLQHAYSLAAELDPAWAAQPLELVHHEGRLALLTKDPGGDPLERLIGRPIEIAQFLRIAISTAVALGNLHNRGIIHRDVKPGSILVEAMTGHVWLTGFGIASLVPRERQPPEPPGEIAGTLAYMAPEQTGRMNRSVDSRSDLYSLGVTLYQMLTGVLPFTATYPMEWVHCHVARQPVSPSERVKGLPESISAIVMKLLQKTPEERYQTAAGVAADLRKCLAALVSVGRIDQFTLGAHDTSDRLLIPEKLYGRESEIQALLASFDRVVLHGGAELVLVYGYSGIGKSSIVNELHKVLVPADGLFAAGKVDRHKRDVPYASLAAAFQTLVRQILAESESELAGWRITLQEQLGRNGQLIVNLIPELEFIIGKQPCVPDLSPQDAQNRFQMAFRRFLSVFARPEHPLTLFLDDLQWLDAATLELLEHLITAHEVRHLLLVGAYRDNEVGPSHPLMRTLDLIRKTGASVQEIMLAPLALDDIACLVADSLHCDPHSARSLAELVHEKTGGNPFFAIQFLTALAEEKLLVFDSARSTWKWDLAQICAKGFTDNVLDLMAGKLSRLPPETREALGQAACLGNVAEIATLALVQGKSENQIHAALKEAVKAGLVFRLDTAYRFLHDRVQEAAYALIPESERAAVHLRIGRLFMARTPPEGMEEKIFEVVNQLNHGTALIDSPEERERVAELNLFAGKRARISTAYASALRYFVSGCTLLADEGWEQCFALIFALEFQRAECEFLTGDFPAAQQRLSILSSRARTLGDSAAVARLQTELYTALDQSDRAVGVGLEYLRRLGINWSAHPTNDEVRQEYQRIWRQLGNRPIETLVDLPPMTDPACLATLDVLTAVEEPAYFTDVNLRCLVVARIANLSLERGNSDGSCVAYVQLGWFVGPRFGDYEAAFRFGKLGLDLVEKRGLERFRARVSQCFAYFINPWSRHLDTSLELLRNSFATAQEAGDLKYAAYACDRLITILLASGAPLGSVRREAEHALEFARKSGFSYLVDIIIGQLRFIRALLGLTAGLSSFSDPEFDEHRFEQHLDAHPYPPFATCWYWIRKLEAHFFAGDHPSALAAASKVEALLHIGPRHFESAEYCFYDALARAAHYDSASSEEQAQHRNKLATHYGQMSVLAETCPENFGSPAALIAAEIARIEDRQLDAESLYENAIQSARQHGFVQNEAIAHEVAARFYSARGFETIAHAYLRNARYCFLLWGAFGKVRQLDQSYPPLYAERNSTAPITTFGTPVAQLDVASVVKASQAVSSEIVLDRLVEALMRIAVEHAGAERGVLIASRGNEYTIEAEARTDDGAIEVAFHHTAIARADLPESVLQYVIRTRENVVLDDALVANLFSKDGYLGRKRIRSMLCLPIVKQAKLVGVLYLENNLTAGAFTADRIALLELLASQAAISLEHAHLYAELQQENMERKRAEEELRRSEASLRQAQSELARVTRLTAMGEMAASIAHEVNQPLAGIVTNANASLRWLAGDSPNLAEAREAIHRIIRDGTRAGDVTKRIRALFTKTRAAKELLNINAAIEEVVVLTEGEMRRNGVHLKMDMAANLPSITGDRVQLQQVVLNLILNGIEAMSTVDDHSRELVISTRRGEVEDEVSVAVRDSGIGIDPTRREKIFDAFHSTKPGGLGLGLSISRTIVEGHGGRLWAVSNDGPGATFQFTLLK
jgi:predicted ATPase/signal transduction histidine kinase